MIAGFGWPHVFFIAKAVGWTVALSAIGFGGGGAIAAIVVWMRISKRSLPRTLAQSYIKIIQGIPLLIQLFLVYFGVSLLGLEVPAIVAAAFGLSINTSAFLADIWRGAIQAVPKGQWDAGHALDLSRPQQLVFVILPQALRYAIGPTVGYLVQVIKGTSLASIIGFVELSRAAQLVSDATFEPLLANLTAAAFYFALCYPLSLLGSVAERNGSKSSASSRPFDLARPDDAGTGLRRALARAA